MRCKECNNILSFKDTDDPTMELCNKHYKAVQDLVDEMIEESRGKNGYNNKTN